MVQQRVNGETGLVRELFEHLGRWMTFIVQPSPHRGLAYGQAPRQLGLRDLLTFEVLLETLHGPKYRREQYFVYRSLLYRSSAHSDYGQKRIAAQIADILDAPPESPNRR